MLSEPIDFADLEKRGIMRKAGESRWYQVLRRDLLPEHTAKRVEEMRSDGRSIWVKFDAMGSKYEKLAEELWRIARTSGLD